MRDIKRRIASIGNIRQITKAMNMIASAKLVKAESRLNAFSPYAKAIDDVAKRVAGRAKIDPHPLFVKREIKRGILILITSDRGLCGAFNANVIDYGVRLLNKSPYKVCLFLIGRKGISQLRRPGYDVIEEAQMPDNPTLPFTSSIADRLIKAYINGECDEVSLLYTEFFTILKQRVKLAKLLPIEGKSLRGFITEHLYEPNKRDVLDEFLSHYVATQILYGLLHSSAAEHAARMLAMDNATKNASEMIDELTLSFNKARQASITKEMIEITTSLEAIRTQLS